MLSIDLPLIAPERRVSGLKPRKVLHHFSKLVEDKEDTEQVFQIIEATKGRRSVRQALAFCQSSEGRHMLSEDVSIPELLDNHDRWTAFPEHTVGRHYVEFMKREGLTAAGLVAESHKWAPPESLPRDQTQWYFDRLRDTHDLFHVLTGYGRDALGEASLLAFSYSQNHNRGILFIAYAGARQLKKVTRTRAPLFSAVREGQRLGRAAARLAHQDIETLMREDIRAARQRLGIGRPSIYRACLTILEREGQCREGLTLSAAAA
ncbi:MAG: Coq4 family protein [Erythrobacter sp.]|nr:Coq4 family protein [Erythrobacter sp.]